MRQVIYSWNYIEWGGAQIHFLALMREAVKSYRVTAVVPAKTDPQLLSFIEDTGARTRFFEGSVDLSPATTIIGRFSRKLRKIKAEYEMLKAIDEEAKGSESIIHTDLGTWQSALPISWLALRYPHFVTWHNSIGEMNPFRALVVGAKTRFVSRLRNFHVFASNKDCLEYFRRFLSDDRYKDARVTYTSVDPGEIGAALDDPEDRESALERFGLDASKRLVFCVGQFLDRKGRWDFLEAAKTLSSERDDVAFVWITNSTLSEPEQERVESYRLEEKFKLVESTRFGDDHVALFKLLKHADVFALASTREGLPISILEAMALGVPTISTNTNAIPEAIENRKTGLLVTPSSPAELAQAIGLLLDDDELRSKLACNGKERVLAEFTDSEVASIAIDAYSTGFGNG
ncbi:MAG: glycosyltransferase family 4 protein [Pyrinomonadaceae bacterium]